MNAKIDYLTYIPTTLDDAELNTMMKSTDYRVRFRAEYFQEKIRANKLENFITKLDIRNETYYAVGRAEDISGYVATNPNTEKFMSVKADCPIDLLKDQLALMQDKLKLFKRRAVYENIILD